MATPMGPPVLPGYSLRVQLFSPHAHGLGDKPIRCFRVVTSPEATIREFCREASRIHEINYGEPLAIKKVQDDQEFDITQSEILGHLFPTTSTIRVIQALANPGIRDSVPPTSALRFDPNITRKREREGSARPNGLSPSSVQKPNKRQKLSELDPDEPLPSRESESGREAGHIPRVNIIPDPQESLTQGSSNAHFGTSRHVRQDPLRIPETPSPSPPAELQTSQYLANGSADHQGGQSAIQSTDDDSKDNLQVDISSPLGQSSERAQSHGSQRGKSSSYHISRPTDRGRSVSTAATSPFSVDQQGPTENGTTPSVNRKRRDPVPKSHEKANRSLDEDSIYDNIVSDDEGAAILSKKKAYLRMRNSPNGGLPGLDWANNKFNTPPTGIRRQSQSREGGPSTGELPLTPNSKEREKRQQEMREADEAKRARRAAAEAAEQRRLEAEEARQAEEACIAGEERAKREEQERLEVEEFQREEAKRQAVISKSARLRKEREEKENKAAEEQRRLEEDRIADEKAESERLAKKAEAEVKRLREKEERERERKAEEAERLRQQKEAREEKRQATEEKRRAGDASNKKKLSLSPEEPRQRQSSSPILPRGTPASTSRPQSSTPYIPNGRKSALKSSMSSQATPSSSASDPKLSPDLSRNVGIDAQMPLPSKLNRKVSFDLHGDRKETPIKPPTRISPPKLASPKVPASTTLAPTRVSKESTPKLSQQGSVILPPIKPSHTPIPGPSTLKRPSLERSTTPAGRTTILPPRKEPTPQVAAKKILPPGRATSQKSETSIQPPAKVKASSAETVVISDSSDSDSEEDIPARVNPAKVATSTSLSSKPSLVKIAIAEPEPSEDEEEIDEDETQSHNSSTRDSRSPVVFISQHAEISKPVQAPSLESESSSDEEDSGEDDEEEEDEPAPKAKPKENEMRNDEEAEGSEESESESEDEATKVQVPKSSPSVFPTARPAKVSAPKPRQANTSKTSITEEEMSAQDEIDQQLTSSMFEVRSTANSSAVPSSSSIRPPQLNYGASLTSLNTKKPLYGSSAAKASTAARSSQASRINLDQGSESESEEESDDDTTSSSDEEELTRKPNSRPIATVTAKKSKPAVSESDDSESSSTDDSSEESVDEETRVRNEVAAQIASMATGNSQINLPSPKSYRSATQEFRGKEAKKSEKKVDKYVSGQKFSMPL